MVDELGAVLNKYEVPMGLMNKLMMLSEYQVLEFMIGESASFIPCFIPCFITTHSIAHSTVLLLHIL